MLNHPMIFGQILFRKVLPLVSAPCSARLKTKMEFKDQVYKPKCLLSSRKSSCPVACSSSPSPGSGFDYADYPPLRRCRVRLEA